MTVGVAFCTAPPVKSLRSKFVKSMPETAPGPAVKLAMTCSHPIVATAVGGDLVSCWAIVAQRRLQIPSLQSRSSRCGQDYLILIRSSSATVMARHGFLGIESSYFGNAPPQFVPVVLQ